MNGIHDIMRLSAFVYIWLKAFGRGGRSVGEQHVGGERLHGNCMSALNLLCLLLVPAVAHWSKLPVNGIPRPAGRSVHVAIFDARAEHYWIHGGSSSTFVADLWSYDFATGSWDQRQQLNQPPGRGDHVAAWDPNSDTFWVHGGYDGVSYLGDLWKYSGYTWTNIAATGPSPRSQHVAVWDPSNSVIWIHGGINSCVLNDELWKFDTKASTWTAWPSSQQPLARASHVAVWDDANQAIWIHGGYSRTCGDFGGLQRDLWRFDTTANSNNWNLVAIGGPTARAYHVAGWDPTNEAIWIHGGLQGANFCSDLWRFDVNLYEWRLLSEKEGPSARFSHAAAFDSTSTSFCLHGGYSDGRLESDLWCYQWTTTTTSRTTSSLTTSSTSKTTSTSLTRSTSITSSSTSSKSRTSTSVSTITLTYSTTLTKTTTSATTSMSTSTSTSSISLSSTTSISMSTTSTDTVTSSTSISSTHTSSTTQTKTSTETSTTSYTSTSTTLSSSTTQTKTSTVTSSTSTSYTSTSSTHTSSTSKTSSSSSTTLTISSSTSSTRTTSSSTRSSTSQTISTSTSSTVTITTTTTTTPEDLTVFYIICPLSGLVIVSLVLLSLLYAWRYCKAHRFVVVPVSQVAVPQAYLKSPEAPPWCLPPAPPSPPPPPVGPPNMIPFNTQPLLPPFESPLSPLAHAVPSEHQIQLILPDLHSPGELTGANDVRINIPPHRCAVSPAPPIVEVLVEVGVQPMRPEYQPKPMVRQLGGQFQDVACQRCVARETQQAPILPMPNVLTTVLMPFLLRPACRLLDGPRIVRIAGHVAPHDESLACDVPDLQRCTEPSEAFKRQRAQSTPPMVRPETLFLTHPMAGPSLVNVTMKPMVQATARLPATMQRAPVLPQTCIQVAAAYAAHLQAPQPLEEPPPPTVNPRGRTCACEGALEMDLTPITLEVSIPCALDRRLVEVLPSEPRGEIMVREPVALSTPAFVWPSAAPKPQYPLQVAWWKPSFETPESLPTSTVIIPVEIPSGSKGYVRTDWYQRRVNFFCSGQIGLATNEM